MDNLKSIGISDDTINKITANNGSSITKCLDINYKIVKDNISFLKNIGIKDIDTLIINFCDVFLWDTIELINAIKKDISLIRLVNEDPAQFSIIFDLVD